MKVDHERLPTPHASLLSAAQCEQFLTCRCGKKSKLRKGQKTGSTKAEKTQMFSKSPASAETVVLVELAESQNNGIPGGVGVRPF